MGIYLPNMEMPKEGFVEVLIRDDGTVQQTGQSNRIGGTDYYTPYVGETPSMYEAIPVPPHGDLIDRDALSKSLDRLCDRVCQYSKAQRKVMCGACPLGDAFAVVEDDAPTIIEADKEGET